MSELNANRELNGDMKHNSTEKVIMNSQPPVVPNDSGKSASNEPRPAHYPETERNSGYWQSLEEFYKDPSFQDTLNTEFMSSPLRDNEDDDGALHDGWQRRDFLKLMGASLALSATSCIRRPVQKIIPYNTQPEEITFGVPNFYTSTYFDGSEALGLLVKTREGRPIKIEGNPSFPLNKGGVSVRAQASLLNLYDPERLQGPHKNLFREGRTNKDTIGIKWEDSDKAVAAQLKKGKVALLTGSIASPSTRAVVKDFCQAFSAEHFQWEVLNHEDVRSGQKASYGDATVPFYRFDLAKLIVSIDADFLGTWLNPTTHAKQFAAARKDIRNMNKLISFDSTMSLTAANADIRFRIKPSQQILVVMSLIAELKKLGLSVPSLLDSALTSHAVMFADLKVDRKLFQKIAQDLYQARGKSLIVAGGMATQTADSMALQVAVNFLNSALGNDGQTVRAQAGNSGIQGESAALRRLIEKMEKGEISTLIVHRVNPVFGWIEGQRFAEATKKVAMVITTSDRMDEVAQISHLILPDHHPLENWGDSEFNRGLFGIQQPAIANMYDTRSFQFNLMTWCYEASQGPKRILDAESYYDYLRSFWKTEIHPQHGKGMGFEEFWQSVLQTGFVGDMKQAGLEGDLSSRPFKQESLSHIGPYKVLGGYELALYTKASMGDGTLANVSWLQELPDPITKIVWDNYAMMSVAAAENEKLKEGSLISLTVNGKTMNLPVHIQPGLHDDVIAVSIGYGRTHVGKVGNEVGHNVLPWGVWDSKNNSVIYAGQKVEMKNLGQTYRLACTQAHHTMEGRQIVVEATLNDYLKKPDANIHKHHIWSMWAGHKYNGHKWGMALDLNSCTGCSSCVIACQSENNIPVVGKKYVLQGREMHWIRIDRYYTGDAKSGDAIGTVFQPVMCQHCDNAPCETVCPVLATVHSSEGLNEMVYNRCVGTRYCSNNCPYKVRRFNWFNYTKQIEAPTNMAMNPDVTVRIRGVMEKCTFCVQRIKEGKNKAKLENRKLQDGEIRTACQSACPSDAIMFGDLNDANSQVAQAFKNEPRSYALLEEWHAAPSVRYMSRIRNNDKETAADHGHGAAPKEHSMQKDQRQQSEHA